MSYIESLNPWNWFWGTPKQESESIQSIAPARNELTVLVPTIVENADKPTFNRPRTPSGGPELRRNETSAPQAQSALFETEGYSPWPPPPPFQERWTPSPAVPSGQPGPSKPSGSPMNKAPAVVKPKPIRKILGRLKLKRRSSSPPPPTATTTTLMATTTTATTAPDIDIPPQPPRTKPNKIRALFAERVVFHNSEFHAEILCKNWKAAGAHVDALENMIVDWCSNLENVDAICQENFELYAYWVNSKTMVLVLRWQLAEALAHIDFAHRLGFIKASRNAKFFNREIFLTFYFLEVVVYLHIAQLETARQKCDEYLQMLLEHSGYVRIELLHSWACWLMSMILEKAGRGVEAEFYKSKFDDSSRKDNVALYVWLHVVSEATDPSSSKTA
ncbi:hypothetical protein DRE_03806 [Drechslerella stenobrocha 248]|uniref:Uncharacterized protein n=1 Tax=Drechslerella stenobrocha 248 TaxID=1043628 RepID=W7HUA8_9PEZI|nr:hypothetical protein DRE_03806 [Drechslerella stenobrocha 248]